MTTIRQLERQWSAKAYEKLFQGLVVARPESTFRLGIDLGRPVVSAAMGVIRLEELSQSHVGLYSELLRTILASQEEDGGWGDPITTALCLRALLCGRGNGVAVERALSYLADLQKAEGAWPTVPIRRMPADGYVTAFLLYQLGDNPRFRQAVRVDDAMNWLTQNQGDLDEDTRQLAGRASLRCRAHMAANTSMQRVSLS